MTESVKIETVRSSSSGLIGRAVSRTRRVSLVLDSSTHPKDDALTNSEAFLAGVSSCGVTLIEMYARETGVPVKEMHVTIEGARTPPEPRFASVSMSFEIVGVDQAQAEALVETYKSR
jgi:uncharacterized OsmC-like protein